MTVLPVVAREMGVLARRKSMYWSRWVTAVLALLVMLWLLLVSSAQLSFAELGKSIFLILSSLCFTFTVLVGTQATADCLSEEKREGTLGLLFLTDLRGFDVIGGKLAASSLQAALALIGVLPMISLSILLGGVTLKQFGEVALVLVNTMFLSLAIGAFVSSLSRNERKAMVGTFVILFAIVLGPWILGMGWRFYLRFPEKLLAISPLYDFAMIHSNPALRPVGSGYFWHSLVGLHLLGWLLLGISALVLPRCVNELPTVRFRRWQELADNFVYGRLEDRKKHRAELLDCNAFLWLASRERVKPRYAWGVLAFFVALYVWIAWQFNNLIHDFGISAAIIFITHLVFKIWVASEVCSRLIQDRRSGALELLLSTPLSVKQIAEGQSLALHRLFRRPIIVLLLMELLLLYGGITAPRRSSAAEQILLYVVLISTFLVDLWALKWVGLWLSLTGKSMERVLLATVSRVLFLPWLVYAAAAGLFGARFILMNTRMDAGTAIFGWGQLAILISVFLGFAARKNFLSQFRELVARRFKAVVEPEPEEEDKSTKTKPRRSTLVVVFKRSPVSSSIVLILFSVVVGFLVRAEYWSYRLRRETAAITSSGFPTTLSEASRYHPAPPVEEDAFAMLRQASPASWAVLPRPGPAFGPLVPNVATGQPSLAALWRLPEFKRAYIDPFANDFWQQVPIQESYTGLTCEDLTLTLKGPAPVPVDRIELGIRTLLAQARLLRQQPVGPAQQGGAETLRRLRNLLEEVLGRDLLDEAVLQKLANDAFAVDDPKALVRMLALQRAFVLDPPPGPWGAVRVMPGWIPGATPMPLQSTLARVLNNLGSREKMMVGVLKLYERAIALAATPYPRSFDPSAFDDPNGIMRMRQLPNGWAAPAMTFSGAFEIDSAFAANLHLVQTALALERYQRRYGKVPGSLAALVPEFLPSVPIDPFTGNALSMFSSGSALLIYSVAADLEGNTAKSPRHNSASRDAVFTFR